MNIKDVHFDNNIFFIFMWKWRLCSHQLLNIRFGHSQNLNKFFAYMWLEIQDNLQHTPNARWLAYCGLHILMRKSMRDAQLLSCSHPVDHTSSPLIFQVHLIDQKSTLSGKKTHDILVYITSFNRHNLKTPRVMHTHFPLGIVHLPCFQILQINLNFRHKTCPWKSHNQRWVKCTQNHPFSQAWELRVKPTHKPQR